jgi:hypothetical protein
MKLSDVAVQENPIESEPVQTEAVQTEAVPAKEPPSDRRSRLLHFLQGLTWKRLRGGALFVLGYLLSPLCWWNDLVFNLPIAYGFGYLCSLFSADWLLPGLISGYWISNVIGILMMQFGAIDALQNQPNQRNLKKELVSGVVSSTIYTVLILALVQLHIIDVPALISEEGTLNFGALIPLVIPGVGVGA